MRDGHASPGELLAVLGYRGAVRERVIHRWDRAIPVYGPRLEAAWAAARAGWCAIPGRLIFGNHSGQVSLRHV